ncbi:hypothetical protein E2C01_028590 [Portunus trituberculatus]|uniref:Uncharacterized protein n=1 Tax=Portunus trituberculatus TaxID=210409 RepID=A0A5B7ELY0_PORTR|nr:hypothetical protein [Portunus trituberculatus]
MNLEKKEKEKVLRNEAKEKRKEKNGDREKEFLLEGFRYETKEVEEGGGHGEGKKLRRDGVRDYLKEKKLDVMCPVETKLKVEIHVNSKQLTMVNTMSQRVEESTRYREKRNHLCLT